MAPDGLMFSQHAGPGNYKIWDSLLVETQQSNTNYIHVHVHVHVHVQHALHQFSNIRRNLLQLGGGDFAFHLKTLLSS